MRVNKPRVDKIRVYNKKSKKERKKDEEEYGDDVKNKCIQACFLRR